LYFCIFCVFEEERHKSEANYIFSPILTEMGYETLIKLTSGR